MLTILASSTPCGCLNQKNGSLTLTILGGTAPYTYMWSDGVTTKDRTGLGVGFYWVVVTDSLSDTGQKSFKIGGSNILIDFTIQQPQGVLQSGSITAVPLSTSASFTYLWSTGATTARIDSLSPGDYQVTVTNAEGCQTVETITLVGNLQYDINYLRCCSSKLAVKYVCQRNGGLFEEAKKTVSALRLIQAYIDDLCYFNNGGVCLTDIAPTLQKAKQFCTCCSDVKDYVSQ